MTKILLVEDDKSLREIYGVRLLAEGYDIVSAGDGEEALAMAIKERPQLIVSDVMMPKISGFDMLDILRSTTETKNIRVIMMTALSSDDQRQRGEQLGADRYLVKSQVGIEDVVRTVHEVLGDAPVAASVFSQTQQPAASPAPVAPQPEVQSQAPQQQQATPSFQNASTAPSQQAASAAPQSQPPQPAHFPPQPTAPFASPRPATLGERVIQPIEPRPETSSDDLAARIASELNESLPNTDAPAPTPVSIPVSQEQPETQPSQTIEAPSETAQQPFVSPFASSPAPQPQQQSQPPQQQPQQSPQAPQQPPQPPTV